jgi:hypothetical protein
MQAVRRNAGSPARVYPHNLLYEEETPQKALAFFVFGDKVGWHSKKVL